MTMRILTQSQYDEYRDAFRERLLSTMDSAMRRLFISRFGGMEPSAYCKAGARDSDLPGLFKTIDAHFDRNLEFLGVTTPADLDKADQRWNSQ